MRLHFLGFSLGLGLFVFSSTACSGTIGQQVPESKYNANSVLTNSAAARKRPVVSRSQTAREYPAGCSERPSSKAAVSEEAKRTLCRTLSL